MSKVHRSSNFHSSKFIRERLRTIFKNQAQLENLKKVPVIEQRTPIWYETRANLITASDFGDALGVEKFGRKTDVKKFYQKKVDVVDSGATGAPQSFPSKLFSSPALVHGVKYEPVATKIYEARYGVKVHEFGLIKHPHLNFLGASPDGINDLGVMLEIKCPYKRVVNDSVLEQYYYQMQGQLDACGLDECDFLEATFEEYQDEGGFYDDYEDEFDVYTMDYKEKGVIFTVSDIEKDSNEYIYSPINIPKPELIKWMDDTIRTLSTTDNKRIVKKDMWFLKGTSIKRIQRHDPFISNMNIKLADIWDNVMKYRNNPSLYHRDMGGGKLNSGGANTSGLIIDKCPSQPIPSNHSNSASNSASASSPTNSKSSSITETRPKKARNMFIIDDSDVNRL
jgi:putative phage-type endonuclease